MISMSYELASYQTLKGTTHKRFPIYISFKQIYIKLKQEIYANDR